MAHISLLGSLQAIERLHLAPKGGRPPVARAKRHYFATPTVHKVRFASERGRCVTHWRSDGTTDTREGALLVCFTGQKNGDEKTGMKKGDVAGGPK